MVTRLRAGTGFRDLDTLFRIGVPGVLSDRQLLEQFATERGETGERASAALVDRHGPMVLRVCRPILRDANDVDDAFQFKDARTIDSENTVEFAQLVAPDVLVIHGRFRPDRGEKELPFLQVRTRHENHRLLAKLCLFLLTPKR
jgi:hypothetical protein